MKSYKSEDVDLFNGTKDETLENFNTDIINNNIPEKSVNNIFNCTTRYCACVYNDCNGVREFGHPLVFGKCFRSWFSICAPVNDNIEDFKSNIDKTSAIEYVFKKMLSGDYAKKSVINIIKRLNRIKYDLLYYRTSCKFEDLYQTRVDKIKNRIIKPILSKKESLKVIQKYINIYNFYKKIIDLSNSQLIDKYKAIIENNITDYRKTESANISVDLFMNKELFSSDSTLSDIRSEALVILYELTFRFLSIIDINPFDNKIPNEEYINDYFKTNYACISNDIVYIFTKNNKTILMCDYNKKIKNSINDEVFEKNIYKYHKIMLGNKVRNLYTAHFGYKILKVKSYNDNLFLFLENGDIVATGSNKNNKISLNKETELLKFHKFDYKRFDISESTTDNISKFDVKNNYVIYLKENGDIYVHGNLNSDSIFNNNILIQDKNVDNPEYIFYKLNNSNNKNEKYKDFYVSDDEKTIVLFTTDDKLKLCTINPDNKISDSIGYFKDITDLLNYDLVTSEEGEESITITENSYNLVRQLILTNNALLIVKNNIIFIKGTYKTLEGDSNYIKIEKEITDDNSNYTTSNYLINKVFLLENDNLFIEYIKIIYDETDIENIKTNFNYSYFMYGIDENGVLGSSDESEEPKQLKLIDITNDICLNNEVLDYNVKFNKIISDKNRTMILNNKNNVFASGLNGGYFCELKNPREDSEDPKPNIEYKFKDIIPDNPTLSNIDNIVINEEKESNRPIVLLINSYKTICFSSLYVLGFKNGGKGYIMNELQIENFLSDDSNKYVTNSSTFSVFSSVNSLYNTNSYYKIMSIILCDSVSKENLNNILQFKESLLNIINNSESNIDNINEKINILLDSSEKSNSIFDTMLSNNENTTKLRSIYNFIIHRFMISDYTYIDEYSYFSVFLNFIGMIAENYNAIINEYSEKYKEEIADINCDIELDVKTRIDNSTYNKYRASII